MKTASVVTVGNKGESLGAMKLSNWLSRTGYSVSHDTAVFPTTERKDLYAFSVVFSWRIPELIEMVNAVGAESEVWIGGPAVSFSTKNAEYVYSRTGIRPYSGIDDRFESEPGEYPMVYFSRGCPAYTPACGLCPVPKIEGNEFRFYRDARPSKLLLDNNLSALPVDYQEEIIERFKDFKGRVDANSGFEPHSFNEDTLIRWKKFPLMFWRFGYDDITERNEALRMMSLLKKHGYHGDKVRVYTMIGNEPKDVCRQRIQEVIDNGFYPWPQRLRPLDWLGPDGTLPTRFDWTEPDLIACQRFYSMAALWRRVKPGEFYYQGRYPLK